ncbi:gibberellin-regulated protein 7 isoform X1 [Brassica napus]|uniref:gibberellin-regulated protein 7 isoform X1 n=1 Tax=Brassica napus TaxID=3708 RepID=UPI0020785D5D|nr:gibberellin-regulated protein 7 isoform X1 [Brassica napus]
MKIILSIFFVASFLLITSSLASATISGEGGGGGAVAPAPEIKDGAELEKWCGGKCEVRCEEAGMKDRCLKYCGICCKECKCVPSGTYGNKHECACYRDKLSSKKTPKCP